MTNLTPVLAALEQERTRLSGELENIGKAIAALRLPGSAARDSDGSCLPAHSHASEQPRSYAGQNGEKRRGSADATWRGGKRAHCDIDRPARKSAFLKLATFPAVNSNHRRGFRLHIRKKVARSAVLRLWKH